MIARSSRQVPHEPLSQVSHIQSLLSPTLIRHGRSPFDPILDEADQSVLSTLFFACDMILDACDELCIAEYGELHTEDGGLVSSNLSGCSIAQQFQFHGSRCQGFAESPQFACYFRRGDVCP